MHTHIYVPSCTCRDSDIALAASVKQLCGVLEWTCQEDSLVTAHGSTLLLLQTRTYSSLILSLQAIRSTKGVLGIDSPHPQLGCTATACTAIFTIYVRSTTFINLPDFHAFLYQNIKHDTFKMNVQEANQIHIMQGSSQPVRVVHHCSIILIFPLKWPGECIIDELPLIFEFAPLLLLSIRLEHLTKWPTNSDILFIYTYLSDMVGCFFFLVVMILVVPRALGASEHHRSSACGGRVSAFDCCCTRLPCWQEQG